MRNAFVSVRTSFSCTRPRRGAVLPLVAVSTVMLMSLLVLVLDGGSLQRYKRLTQTAADAGALAAAIELYRRQTPETIEASARNETSRNGFTHLSDGAVVPVNQPPASGYFAGATNYVEVIVQKTVPMLFAGIMGIPTKIVTSRAVAGFAPDNSCLYVLSPTASKALDMNSGADVHTKQCGVQVNSSANGAVYVHGNSTLDVDGGLAVVGGLGSSPGQIVGTVLTGAPPAPDPLAYLQMPAMGACTYTNLAITTSRTLDPGVYCGGLHITTSGVVVTLNPGMYYMAGGGLEVTTNATLNGDGVTIVLTNAPGDLTGATYGFDVSGRPRHGIRFFSGGTGTLKAMTTGPLAGVLFYQDPLAGVPGMLYDNAIHASTGLNLIGTMYFPTQNLELNTGSAALVITGGIVAKTVSLASNANITITGISGGTEYFALKKGSIVE